MVETYQNLSSDITLSYYDLISPNVSEERLTYFQKAKKCVYANTITSKVPLFFRADICKLLERWAKVVASDG